MFGRGIPLFSLFGIRVKLDPSWFLIVVILAWSLAERVFPSLHGSARRATAASGRAVDAVAEPSTTAFWIMGVVGALGLFASILAHEFGHAIVANRRGLPVRGITLFLFGGVAELSREPDSAKDEFWVAIAGPIVSVALGVGFLALSVVPLPIAVALVVSYLGVINLVVVAFNLIPAYPLDGGRVLRSILWGRKGDLLGATRIAAAIGGGFGVVLMVFAVFRLLAGDVIAAAFTFLIGMFIRGASARARAQVELRTTLSGRLVRELMNDRPRTVSSSETLERFVEDHVYRHHFKMFPVTRDGGDELAGCIRLDEVREVPRERWARTLVADLADGCTEANTIDADADASAALLRMNESKRGKLLVVDASGRLVGVLTLKDLMGHVEMRRELEGLPG